MIGSVLFGYGAVIQTEPDGYCTGIEHLSVGDHVLDLSSGRDMTIHDMNVHTLEPEQIASDAGFFLTRCEGPGDTPFLIGLPLEYRSMLTDFGSRLRPQELLARNWPTVFYQLECNGAVTCGLGAGQMVQLSNPGRFSETNMYGRQRRSARPLISDHNWLNGIHNMRKQRLQMSGRTERIA